MMLKRTITSCRPLGSIWHLELNASRLGNAVRAEEIEFDQWWSEFLAELGRHRDSYESIRELQRYLAGLSREKRQSFERCLTDLALARGEGASVALAALEKGALRGTCEALVALACDRGASDSGLREDALRVLARSSLPQAPVLLEHYLLDEPLGHGWSSVPWSLWPQYAQLFVRAWSRYFSEQTPEVWCGTAVVQAFLNEPLAVRQVRNALQVSNSIIWRKLCEEFRREANAQWLSSAERDALLGELVV